MGTPGAVSGLTCGILGLVGAVTVGFWTDGVCTVGICTDGVSAGAVKTGVACPPSVGDVDAAPLVAPLP